MRSVTSIKSVSVSAILAAALMVSIPARATIYNLDFTGVITNSRDSGGIMFGAASSGGQNGQSISGRIVIDDGGYIDQNGTVYYGVYSPTNGLFPQPSDYFTSTYTIDGQTFTPSRWMGPANGHSLESAAIQDIPPVNYVQQDILQYVDGSQELYCSNPLVPATCTGGALSTDQLQLKLFGVYDFVGSDALTQLLSLGAVDINAIVGAPGGGQSNYYTGYQSIKTSTGFLVQHDFGGEFNLTSLSLQVAAPAAVPVPGAAWLFVSGILGLFGVARKRLRAQ